MDITLQQLPWAKAQRLPRKQAQQALQQPRCCPLCDEGASEEIFSLLDFQFFTDQDGVNRADHRVVVCQKCGLIYTNPCYTPYGFQVLFDKAGQSYGHTEGRIHEQVSWLGQHFPDVVSIMDVGCGAGDLLRALPDKLQRFGIDVDVHTLNRAAQSAPDIHFSVCDFDGLQQLPQVDVITMFHVLEHLANPGHFLKQLRQLCQEDVALVVEVPVVDRAVEEQDRDMVGFFTIQHLTHFSKQSLQQMMALNGWQVVHAEAMAGYNGWRVVAEPGQLSGTELTKDESGLAAARSYLQLWQKNVDMVRKNIATIAAASKVMVWGAGQHTEYLALLTGLFNREAEFVLVDSDPLKQGQHYHGIPVLSPDQVPPEVWSGADFPIVISTYGGQESLISLLKSKAVSEERIIALYDRTQRY